MPKLRVIPLLVCAVALAAPAGAVAASKKRKTPPCASAGKTVLANAQARIYRTRGGEDPSAQGGVVYWGCRYASPAKRYWLGTDVEDVGGPGGLQLVGHLVGFIDGACGKSGCLVSLGFISLRTGQITEAVRYVDDYVGGYVLKPNGSMAWTRVKRQGSAMGGELWKREAGINSLIDSGGDLDSSSLALSQSTVYWMKGGQPRSALLR